MKFFRKKECNITASDIARLAKNYSLKVYFYFDCYCDAIDIKKCYYHKGGTPLQQATGKNVDSYWVYYPLKRFRRGDESEDEFFKGIEKWLIKNSKILEKEMWSNKELYEKTFNIELP